MPCGLAGKNSGFCVGALELQNGGSGGKFGSRVFSLFSRSSRLIDVEGLDQRLMTFQCKFPPPPHPSPPSLWEFISVLSEINYFPEVPNQWFGVREKLLC